ncbi:MAG: HlyD family efflux transporter periplasmic adaptor subunit, partial [Acidiferrobacterales bacterium]
MDSPEPTFPSSQRPSERAEVTPEGAAVERERFVWAQFAEADSADAFCGSWLAIQCRMIADVMGGLVLLGPADAGPFTPAAVWPDVRRSMQHLTAAAERALKERRGLLLSSQAQSQSGDSSTESYHVAYPLEIEKALHGVVVLEVPARPQAQLQAILRQLHWGSAWLEVLLRRQQSHSDALTQKRLATVLDLVAVAVEEDRFYAAALALVTELATRLACDRVSVGFVRKNYVAVVAISHTAQFEKKTNLVRSIGSAMDECFDQQATILYPTPATGDALVNRAHEELAQVHSMAVVCSVPLYRSGEIVGTLTFERSTDNPFDTETVELCEALASVSGPILDEKRKSDRLIIWKIAASVGDQLKKLVGPRHVVRKLVLVAVTAFALFLAFAKGDYRVAADAALEGQIQRVLAVPFASYISEANARAGDVVKQGEVLAILDDKDLRLERLKAAGQRQQLLKQYREAMASHDRPQMQITTAQLSQVDAQLQLLEYQLSRTEIKAPFKGIIVSGDLSQSLGAPVETGQVLFEMAPLDAYRVVLRVDERDITAVSVEQSGQLALSSIPNERLSFTVEKITPVSVAEEGRNYVRVEARLDDPSERLRP